MLLQEYVPTSTIDYYDHCYLVHTFGIPSAQRWLLVIQLIRDIHISVLVNLRAATSEDPSNTPKFPKFIPLLFDDRCFCSIHISVMLRGGPLMPIPPTLLSPHALPESCIVWSPVDPISKRMLLEVPQSVYGQPSLGRAQRLLEALEIAD